MTTVSMSAKPTPGPKTGAKRKAADADSDSDFEIVETRKVKTSRQQTALDLLQQHSDALFQVSVTTHPKFDKFPTALRVALQTTSQSSVYTHLSALSTGTSTPHYQTYSILTGRRIRGESTTFKTVVQISDILELSTANISLLQFFVTRQKLDLGKKVFVELESMRGVANPKFLEFYTVRKGDLGWGFDDEGCLSLYAAVMREEGLLELVWYVMKDGIKIEDGA
jgi:hypothetical protein